MAYTMVYRGVKGSPLTNAEVDTNFQNLDTYKAPLDNPAFTTAVGVTGQVTAVSATGALIASNGSGTGQTSIQWKRVGAATDQKLFEAMQDGTGNFVLRSTNDAYTQNHTFLLAKRSTTYTLASLQLMGAGGRVLVGTGTDDGVNALQVTGNIEGDTKLLLTGTTSGLEIGSTTSTGTPTIDLHSSGTTADYDARISATGGSATVGQGTLTATALAIVLASGGSSTLTLTSNGRSLFNTSTDDGATMVQIQSPSTGNGLKVWRNGTAGQGIALGSASNLDSSALLDNKLTSYSSASNAKQLYIHSTTDDANTATTGGALGINFKILASTYGRFWQSGRFGLGSSVTDDGTSQLQVQGDTKVTGDIIGTGSSTVRSDYRFIVARNSTSFTPYMYIINSAWTQSALPTTQTSLGNLSIKWGSTTGDDTAGPNAGDFITYGNTDGTSTVLVGARTAANVSAGKLYLNGSGTVVVNSTYDDKSTKFTVTAAASTPGPINTPTVRVVDDGNATSGGLTIESYQPIIQLIDRSASAKNSRIMQNAGSIYFANDPGDNSGSYASPGFIINPDGYIQIGNNGTSSANVWAYLNGSSVGTGTSQYGVYFNGEFNSSATSTGYVFLSTPKLQATAFTMTNLQGFYASAPVLGSGSAITNYYAFFAADSSVATNNFGFRSNLTAGTNKWNFYANGTAPSYFNGRVLLGSTTDNGTDQLQVTGSATVTGVINANSGVALPDGFFQMVTSSRRNRIINGCFRVVTRPVVSLGASGSLYGMDRWKFANGHTAGAFTIGNSAITPDATGVTVPSSRMLCTTATGTGTLAGYYGILTGVEGFECYDLRNQPVTVSFIWYSNWTGTAAVSLRDGTNSVSCVQTISVTAGAVKYYSVTFPAVPLTASVPYTSAAGLTLNIGCVGPTGTQATSLGVWQSGSLISHASATPWGQTVNNEFRVAEVQLEAGTTATPFERRGVETEFAMCRRFWQKIPIIKVWGYAGAASTFIGGTTLLQTPMRAIPSVNVSSGWAYQNCSGGTFETISNYELTYYAGSTAAGGLSYTASNVFLDADY